MKTDWAIYNKQGELLCSCPDLVTGRQQLLRLQKERGGSLIMRRIGADPGHANTATRGKADMTPDMAKFSARERFAVIDRAGRAVRTFDDRALAAEWLASRSDRDSLTLRRSKGEADWARLPPPPAPPRTPAVVKRFEPRRKVKTP